MVLYGLNQLCHHRMVFRHHFTENDFNKPQVGDNKNDYDREKTLTSRMCLAFNDSCFSVKSAIR